MAKYPKSVMTDDMDHCYICGKCGPLEIHHVFGGPNRSLSTKYGLVVPLCHKCHNQAPDGVHFNAERMAWLRMKGQEAFEKHYPGVDFCRLFGTNWKYVYVSRYGRR